MQCFSGKAGFNVIEFLIILVVLSVFGAIAFPAYQEYRHRLYFAEIVQAVVPYKASVEACAQRLKKLSGCSAGSHGIPAAITTPVGAVAALTVINGVITAVPVPAAGVLAIDTYILTPKQITKSATLNWTVTGGGVTKKYN